MSRFSKFVTSIVLAVALLSATACAQGGGLPGIWTNAQNAPLAAISAP